MKDQDEIRLLVKNAQKGDRESFGKIYDYLIDRIYRFMYFRTGNKEESEDLTESVFLKAYEKLSTYHDNGLPFEAWVFRIARNQLVDHYRTKKQSVQLDETSEIEDKKPNPEDIAEQNIQKQMILQGIRQLPSTYQEIIIFKFIEERENKEIGLILDKPVEQVRVLQSRALKALKKVLEWQKS